MSKRYDKPLTAGQLALLRDEEIDTSDIPELDDKFWANARLTPPRDQGKLHSKMRNFPDQGLMRDSWQCGDGPMRDSPQCDDGLQCGDRLLPTFPTIHLQRIMPRF